jgi:hypothetical protein
VGTGVAVVVGAAVGAVAEALGDQEGLEYRPYNVANSAYSTSAYQHICV